MSENVLLGPEGFMKGPGWNGRGLNGSPVEKFEVDRNQEMFELLNSTLLLEICWTKLRLVSLKSSRFI